MRRFLWLCWLHRTSVQKSERPVPKPSASATLLIFLPPLISLSCRKRHLLSNKSETKNWRFCDPYPRAVKNGFIHISINTRLSRIRVRCRSLYQALRSCRRRNSLVEIVVAKRCKSGRSKLRLALYMCAVVIFAYNPAISPYARAVAAERYVRLCAAFVRSSHLVALCLAQFPPNLSYPQQESQ